MTSATPSSPYFNGIVYNPSFFTSSTGTYLNYPLAQGTETISTLKTSSIDSATPTTAMTLFGSQTANLTMATAVTGTIRLGAYTTTSTHIGNIDHQNNNINNASAPLVGSLGLGTSQTDGILNIGTGSRTTTGAINIGTGATAGIANPITIGSSSSNTSLYGTVSVMNGNLLAYGSIACGSYLSASSGGTGSCLFGSNVNSGIVTLGNSLTTGTLELANYNQFAGTVNIANSATSSYANNIKLGNAYTTTTIGGALTNTGLITASGGIKTSTIDTATGGSMAIGASSTGGITLGFGNASTTVAGSLTSSGQIIANAGITVPTGQTLTVNGTLKSSSLDAISDTTAGTTALTIGSNVIHGNIVIGNSQTDGDIIIGASDASGATITVGTTSTATTINGASTLNGNVSIGSNNTVFTTSGQQLRLGYANTQTTGLSTSSFGPFIKSFGPATVTSSTYTILYEGTNGLFTSTGVDGCGGLLTIFMKSGAGKFATYLYTVVKRAGAISLNASLWTSNPVVGNAISTNDIIVTFNASDWSGATVSWTFLGSV